MPECATFHPQQSRILTFFRGRIPGPPLSGEGIKEGRKGRLKRERGKGREGLDGGKEWGRGRERKEMEGGAPQTKIYNYTTRRLVATLQCVRMHQNMSKMFFPIPFSEVRFCI